MFEIKLDQSQLQHGLAQLLRNAANSRPMMRTMDQELDTLTKDNFENEAFGDEKWQQSQSAAERGGQTLTITSTLRDATTTEYGNGFARIGNNMKYAAVHHLGGAAGRKNKRITLPARPYLPINGNGQWQNNAKKTITDVVLDALKKGL